METTEKLKALPALDTHFSTPPFSSRVIVEGSAASSQYSMAAASSKTDLESFTVPFSIFSLFGYKAAPVTEYENRYSAEDYYWGLEPNSMCYEALRMLPPLKPLRVLDIGCGEGKDAVFFARNGYIVDAFDVAESGLDKARSLADKCGVNVNFFRADVNDFIPEEKYDIIFSSGVFHYIRPERRLPLIEQLKTATNPGGLSMINAFVEKPFIAPPPDAERIEFENGLWKSGEIFTAYHDWLLKRTDEIIFDCMSSNQPHQHCMDIVIAQKPQ